MPGVTDGFDPEVLLAVDLVEGAREAGHHGLDLRQRAERAGERRGAGAVEIVVHLIAHDRRLFAHTRRHLLRSVLRLVDDDAERRLQRVRQVADLGARPVEDLSIGFEKKVQLARQGCDVARILAANALRLPAPDGAEARTEIDERLQAEADLEERREAERRAEQREGDDERDQETAHVGVDLVGGPRDADDEPPVFAEVDVSFDDAQPAIIRRVAVAPPDLSEAIVLDLAGQARQRAAEERFGRAHLLADRTRTSDLPVPAGQGQFEARVADRTEIAIGVPRGDEVGGQIVGVDEEPLVETAFRVLPVERQKDQGRDEQDHEAPEHRGGRKADGDGASGQIAQGRRQADHA